MKTFWKYLIEAKQDKTNMLFLSLGYQIYNTSIYGTMMQELPSVVEDYQIMFGNNMKEVFRAIFHIIFYLRRNKSYLSKDIPLLSLQNDSILAFECKLTKDLYISVENVEGSHMPAIMSKISPSQPSQYDPLHDTQQQPIKINKGPVLFCCFRDNDIENRQGTVGITIDIDKNDYDYLTAKIAKTENKVNKNTKFIKGFNVSDQIIEGKYVIFISIIEPYGTADEVKKYLDVKDSDFYNYIKNLDPYELLQLVVSNHEKFDLNIQAGLQQFIDEDGHDLKDSEEVMKFLHTIAETPNINELITREFASMIFQKLNSGSPFDKYRDISAKIIQKILKDLYLELGF
jgi:hypothetical protein